MVLTTVSLAACAWHLGFAWYLVWRILPGITGGILMVLAAPAVLARTPAELRPRMSGVVFTGVGVGIAAAGTLVPALAQQGIPTVWLALAAVSLALTVYLWLALPADVAVSQGRSELSAPLTLGAALLLASYALDATGFIPHTVFLVDFIARGLGQGLQVGGAYWMLFGVSAAAGPMVVGLVAERIGFGPAYVSAMVVKGLAVALPLLSTSVLALAVSSVVVGALVAGTTSLLSGWVAERFGLPFHRQIWGWMTSAFGGALALAGYGFSAMFARGVDYDVLFAIGATSLFVGAALAAISGPRRQLGR
jgi:predicted MFS family arabinose efflux permease